MSEAQMLWYAQVIGEEKEESFKYNLSIIEYLASFWNAEAVQSVRDKRSMAEDDRFASDQEFEKQLEDKDFLAADKIVQSIRDKYKHTNLQGNDRQRESVVRSPRDLSGLFKITKKR